MKHIVAGISAALAALALVLAPACALATPISYAATNVAMDTPQALAASVITAVNASSPAYAYTVSCSGTTTSTCTGTRIVASVTGLTTAAGVTSAAMAVTDTSVVATSLVLCQVLGYGGTGNPAAVNVVPTASTITFAVENLHASAALNATVPVACMVYN